MQISGNSEGWRVTPVLVIFFILAIAALILFGGRGEVEKKPNNNTSIVRK